MEETTSKKTSLALSPKELLQKYIRYAPWVILSVLLALTFAWLKLRWSAPVYNVVGKIIVKDKNPYGKGPEKYSNIFSLPDDNSNINNEIEIIKSSSMGLRAVRRLNLQKQYFIKGKVRTSIVRSSDLPFTWIINRIVDSAAYVSVSIKVLNEHEFQIDGAPQRYNFNQRVKLPAIEFELRNADSGLLRSELNEYMLSWVPEMDLALQLSGSISAAKLEGTTVVAISYPTENVKLGIYIVDQYMKEYLQSNYEDKRIIALNTLQFIDSELDTLRNELGIVEKNLQKFREKNEIFIPDQQMQLFFEDLSETRKQISQEDIQKKILDYLYRYMSNPANSDKLVPSNLGIQEPTLMAQLTEFNTLQLKKETLLKTTQPNNGLVITATAAIERLRQDILENLRNVKNAQDIAATNLQQRTKDANTSIQSMPGKQKQLQDVTRQQAVLQELYSFLLQKKLETAISSASTTSDISILEPALVDNVPISPNRKSLYTIALFLGIAVPVGIIFLVDYLNDKIKTKNDIIKATNTPILGEVGHSEGSTALVVTQDNRSYIAEQFRIIRSNLQFVLPKSEKPVILVTSSFSGEGKSFVSTNVAAALALSGKKTVILEMDIRKPKILQGLGMNERRGITNFIVNANMRYTEIIYPVAFIENLFVVPCGPVPPNPAEILLNERLNGLFEELHRQFDAILIDTAPIGIVSDAISLGKHANCCLYIVRDNYTLKKQIKLIDELYSEKKLPNLAIVINDIRVKDRGYGYGYGYGQGYGYGYGSSRRKGNSGYYFNDKEQRRRWWPFGRRKVKE